MDIFPIVMGQNEAAHLGQGWYEREIPADGPPYRATKELAELVLPPGGPLELEFLLQAPPARPDRPFTGRFTVRDGAEADIPEESARFQLVQPQWSLRRCRLPASDEARVLLVEVDTPWKPSDIFSNGDGRSMGVLVAAVSTADPAGV